MKIYQNIKSTHPAYKKLIQTSPVHGRFNKSALIDPNYSSFEKTQIKKTIKRAKISMYARHAASDKDTDIAKTTARKESTCEKRRGSGDSFYFCNKTNKHRVPIATALRRAIGRRSSIIKVVLFNSVQCFCHWVLYMVSFCPRLGCLRISF